MIAAKICTFFWLGYIGHIFLFGTLPSSDWLDKKNTIKKEIRLKDEKSLKVNINFGAGNLEVKRGDPEKILDAYIEFISKIEPRIEYEVYKHKGLLDIMMSGRKDDKDDKEIDINVKWSEIGENRWDIGLTDSIPISLFLDIGAAKSNLDMTGLKLEELDIETGASGVTIKFDKPNLLRMRQLRIETGAGKLRGENLGNANCEQIKFEGGVGNFLLDFRGDYSNKTEAKISCTFGSLTLLVPKNTGVRIVTDCGLLTTTSISDEFEKRRKHEYYSPNWGETKGELDIHVEVNFTSLTIDFVD